MIGKEGNFCTSHSQLVRAGLQSKGTSCVQGERKGEAFEEIWL